MIKQTKKQRKNSKNIPTLYVEYSTLSTVYAHVQCREPRKGQQKVNYERRQERLVGFSYQFTVCLNPTSPTKPQ